MKRLALMKKLISNRKENKKIEIKKKRKGKKLA